MQNCTRGVSLPRCRLSPPCCTRATSMLQPVPHSHQTQHPAPHHAHKPRERPCAQTCTETPTRDVCGESFKELCTPVLKHFHNIHGKNSSHKVSVQNTTVTTDLKGVKPPCKGQPHFAAKSTGTELTAVGVLQWKPGAGWQWVTRNH